MAESQVLVDMLDLQDSEEAVLSSEVSCFMRWKAHALLFYCHEILPFHYRFKQTVRFCVPRHIITSQDASMYSHKRRKGLHLS